MMNMQEGKAMLMKIDTEQYSFQLILHSGNARSLAYEALQMVKSGSFDEGVAQYLKAKEELIEAKKMHAELLRIMANNEGLDINLLLIHAEDHITSSSMMCEVYEELIDMYKKMEELR